MADEDLHRLILDALAEAVCTVDARGCITSFNRAAGELTGVTPAAAIGRAYSEVLRSDSCYSEDLIRRTQETGEPLRGVACALAASSGEPVPVLVNTAAVRGDDGTVLGVVITIRDNRPVELLRKELRHAYTRHDIVTKSPRMRRLLDLVPTLAASDSTVLISGPTGSGKELFARAVHRSGPRAERPFVAVNCGALPDNLLESELFGYRKGAFTDAVTDKPGRLALAGAGTLLLDEIGDISPAMQVKLLRVLQERVYEPLGAVTSEPLAARVIAATNRDLEAAVRAGTFRSDLFYRLHVLPVELPGLAERREDIPLLVDHFLRRFAAAGETMARGIHPDALAVLMRHDYPGNIRELENLVEHACVICAGETILPEHLPAALTAGRPAVPAPAAPPTSPPAAPADLAGAEAAAVRAALTRHAGNRSATAAELGIHPSTLWRKMKKYGI